MYLVCVSALDYPKKPFDLLDPQIEDCPLCKKPMWICRRKRKLREMNSQYKAWCVYCVLKDQLDKGVDAEELVLIDILKVC